MSFNKLAYRVELTKQRLTQRALCLRMGFALSTFSDYVHGLKCPPPDFVRSVERELKLKKGALEVPSPAPRATRRKPGARASGVK